MGVTFLYTFIYSLMGSQSCNFFLRLLHSHMGSQSYSLSLTSIYFLIGPHSRNRFITMIHSHMGLHFYTLSLTFIHFHGVTFLTLPITSISSHIGSHSYMLSFHFYPLTYGVSFKPFPSHAATSTSDHIFPHFLSYQATQPFVHLHPFLHVFTHIFTCRDGCYLYMSKYVIVLFS
jgi:hypothetical protein